MMRPAHRPLRVAIIGNYRPDRQESMLRYGAMMASMLASPEVEPSFHAAPPVLERLSPNGWLAKWLGYLDKFVIFPFRLARIAARSDLVHICDHSNALYCRFTGRVTTLLTCHDLLAVRAAAGDFPAYRPGVTGRLLQRLIRGSLRHADHIVCVSEATRRDVRRLVGPVAATVIENPLHYPYAPLAPAETAARLAAAGVGEGRFFLHVGGNQWYKNREGVVALFAHIGAHEDYRGHRLVLAGKELPDALLEMIARAQLADRVVMLPAPDDALLNALYCGADALLFPSLHEGFGWPIAEAQAAGCPVVTSDRAPMRDVAGPDGAILVDPEDPAAAAATFMAARHRIDRFRANGLRNAAQRDRDATADRYRALIASLRRKEVA